MLSLERADVKASLFTRLIATLPKSFYFFFNRMVRYAQSKEKVEIFLAKTRKSPVKQFLEIAYSYSRRWLTG